LSDHGVTQHLVGHVHSLSFHCLTFLSSYLRESKPYAGPNDEQVMSPQKRLNYLARAADDELRENAQRNVEYLAAGFVKQPKLKRIALAATGTWVAPGRSSTEGEYQDEDFDRLRRFELR
jgi:hypothetical protein